MSQLQLLTPEQQKAHDLAATWRGLAEIDYKYPAMHHDHADTLVRCATELENKFGILPAEPRKWD